MDMSDTIVSFETAKLAKEKGFDLKCIEGYSKEGILVTIDSSSESILGGHSKKYKNSNLPELSREVKNDSLSIKYHAVVTAPTQSLLQKWLREKYKINVYVFEKLVFKGDLNEHKRLVCNIGLDEVAHFSIMTPYEEALEVGLQEALKLV